jgi:hypothetical protein
MVNTGPKPIYWPAAAYARSEDAASEDEARLIDFGGATAFLTE